MEPFKGTTYLCRVTYGTDLYLVRVPSQQLGNLVSRIETRWPELECLDYSIVCHDEKGRTCYVDGEDIESTVDLLLDMFGKEHKGPRTRLYLMLNMTVQPKAAKLTPTVAVDARPKHSVDRPEPSGKEESKNSPRPMRYRYQVRYGNEVFISPHYNTLGFSWQTIRKDVDQIWPRIAGSELLVQTADGGDAMSVTVASLPGLFDCFAHEVVRSTGDSVLVLKLSVGNGETFEKNLSSCPSDDPVECHAPEGSVTGGSSSAGTSSWVKPDPDEDSDSTIYGLVNTMSVNTWESCLLHSLQTI
ncbi:hypothetical protein FOL47_003772 [Perkinsus chesapeaki]|uniref:Uncharacterized protein n=1 Tax=Perkinsus chesapeaki TaxID=330153 RepID=A0A7J6MZH9_PERCH|nr:hypothetical protein FOL47_003772 [Perkinsus chesapeaki]